MKHCCFSDSIMHIAIGAISDKSSYLATFWNCYSNNTFSAVILILASVLWKKDIKINDPLIIRSEDMNVSSCCCCWVWLLRESCSFIHSCMLVERKICYSVANEFMLLWVRYNIFYTREAILKWPLRSHNFVYSLTTEIIGHLTNQNTSSGLRVSRL